MVSITLDDVTPLDPGMLTEARSARDRLLEIQRDVPARRPRFPALVLEYGIELHRWEVSWLDELERRLGTSTKEAA